MTTKSPKPKNPSKTQPTLLIHDKKAMKKIVAKHEDVMGFFDKIKVRMKVKNKNNAEKSTKNNGNDNNDKPND